MRLRREWLIGLAGLLILLDIILRIWVGKPDLPAAGQEGQQLLSRQEYHVPPLDAPFDPFYSEVKTADIADPQRLTELQVEVEQSNAASTYTYRLLGTMRDMDGRLQALIGLQIEPQPTDDPVPPLQVVMPGDHLGDARVLAIRSRDVQIESDSRGKFTLELFVPQEKQ